MADKQKEYKFDAKRKLAAMRLTDSEQRAIFYELMKRLEPEQEMANYDLLAAVGEFDEQGEQMMKTAGTIQGLRTGFIGLDQMTMGLWPNDLVIVAARTSHGKTQLAANVTYRVAEAGTPVLFITLEMTHAEMNGFFQLIGGQPLQALPILTQRPDRVTVTDLDKIIQAALVEGIGLVVIDHLHYLVERGEKNQAGAVGQITYEIKQLARKYNLPIILLAQLNREGSKSEDVNIYHLKDSSYIEQDADVVLLLERGGLSGSPEILRPDELRVKLGKWRKRLKVLARETTLRVDGAKLVEQSVPHFPTGHHSSNG